MSALVLFLDEDLGVVGRARVRRVPESGELVVFQSPRSAWKVSRVVWFEDVISGDQETGLDAAVVLSGTNEEAMAFECLGVVLRAVGEEGKKEDGS